MSDVVVDKEKARANIYASNALSRVSGLELYKMVISQQMLLSLYEQNPDLSNGEAVRQITDLWTKLESDPDFVKLSFDELSTVFGSLLQLISVKLAANKIGSGPFQSGFNKALESLFGYFLKKGSVDFTDPNKRINAVLNNSSLRSRLFATEREILEKVALKAPSNIRFTRANDDLFAAQLVASARDSAETIINNNPNVEALKGIRDLLTATGEIKTNLADLTRLADERFNAILDQLGEANTKLDDLIVSQDFIVNGVGALLVAEAERRAIEDDAKRRKLILQDAAAGVFLLGTLIGLKDAKLGRQVTAVGDGALQIADSVFTFIQAVNKKGVTDAIFSLGTAALTGNVVQAALTIVSAFADSGPTVEQVILDEIKRVQEQIDRLGQHLDRRFDRIERFLTNFYRMAAEQFGEILDELAKVNRKLDTIHANLIALQKRLDRVEANILGAIMATEESELFELIHDRISFKERTGDNLDKAKFSEAAAKFASHALERAYSAALLAPVAGRKTDLEDVADELQISTPQPPFHINRDLNFLMELSRFGPNKEKKWNPNLTLPNVGHWLHAANAYVELFADWPNHGNAYPGRMTEAGGIESNGQRFLDALLQISTMDPDNGLFTELFNQYNAQTGSCIKSIDDEEAKEKNKRKIDLFSEQLAHQPASAESLQEITKQLSSMPHCSGGATTFGAPKEAVREMIRPPFIHASKVFGDEIRLCHDIEISIERDPDLGRTFFDIKARIQSQLRKAGSTVWETIESRIFEKEGLVGGPLTKDSVWQMHKEAFLLEATIEIQNAPLEAETAARYNDTLGTWRKDFYIRVTDAADSPESGIGLPARRLTGAAAIIRTFVVVGFPRMMERDDFLRRLVHGDGKIVDHDRVAEIYRNASRDDLKVKQALKEQMETRSKDMEDRLKEILTLIRSEQFEEGMPSLSRTISRLHALAQSESL